MLTSEIVKSGSLELVVCYAPHFKGMKDTRVGFVSRLQFRSKLASKIPKLKVVDYLLPSASLHFSAGDCSK